MVLESSDWLLSVTDAAAISAPPFHSTYPRAMGRERFVVIQEDMPKAVKARVMHAIISALKPKRSDRDVDATLYSASERISEALTKIEDKEWQVVVVHGSFTSTCTHKPGRLLSLRLKPYSIVVWQSS